LHLSEKATGSLNLKEYDALWSRKNFGDNFGRFNYGIIAAAVYNAAPGDPGRTPMSPLDFVPEWRDKVASQQHDMTKMTPEQQRDYLFTVFGKRVLKRK